MTDRRKIRVYRRCIRYDNTFGDYEFGLSFHTRFGSIPPCVEIRTPWWSFTIGIGDRRTPKERKVVTG